MGIGTGGGESGRLPASTAEWMSRQRWYAGKPRVPRLEHLASFDLHSPEAGVTVRTHLLTDTSGSGPVVYQVPVTSRVDRLPGADQALIGTLPGADDTVYVYDGPHDPVYGAALATTMLAGGSSVVSKAARAEGHPLTNRLSGSVERTRVLTGEQSNTSIILSGLQGASGSHPAMICKVFRTLQHGENPDVVVQSALAAAGSPYVPRPVGALEGWWPAPDAAGEAHGHLAFAQEFLPDVDDAWRVAVAAADRDEDFADRARTLGRATAHVHETLASVLPTIEPTASVVADAIAGMRERYASAAAEVPELAEFADPVESVFAASATAAWPRLQRIHGDYHLGQVLDVPGRGWILLDFEGEPLRPLSSRSLPDAPERDVAGMLRSFSYVAGSVASSSRDAIGWATTARAGFLAGYHDVAGDESIDRRILDAFELDKAVYEAVYESRNRPAWLPIPLRAVRRLADRAGNGNRMGD